MIFRRFVIVSALVLSFVATPTFAGRARELDRRIGRILETMPADGKATLRDISLGRESLDALEIEPMEVWAKDAKIIAFGPAGEETIIPPPDVKYFKGRVAGEDDSAVFLSRSADGSTRGMVILGERRFVIGTGVRKAGRTGPYVNMDGDARAFANAPLLISEIDEIDALHEPDSDWTCDIDQFASKGPLNISGLSARAQKKPRTDDGNVAGATYQLRIAVETDNEFCAAFGNNSTTLTTYIGDLVGKASIVYSRDVDTTLILGETHLRTGGAGTDPWTQSTAHAILAQFGTYWHNNYSLGYPDSDGGGAGTAGGGVAVARSSAVFLSGRLLSEGVAWVEVLCLDNFFCGATGAGCGSATFANSYGGAYAFNSSSGSVTTTIPDPEATVNGVQYGIPNGNYWMLLEVMHELGHNVASPHSSCVALSPAEQATYGVAPRAFVDQCLSGGSGCYSGATSAPVEKGSIMSYCHNITSGGFRQSRYLFGKAAEPSEKMLPIFNGGLEGCTPDVTITVQTQPVSCSAGRTASVATCSGCTYQWSIEGGTITSSSTIAAITYTPNATEVALTVTILTSRGCGITATREFLSSCVSADPPTNVAATATSTSNVNVSWTAAVGAVTYNVYRSTDGTNYVLAGFATAPTVLFNDGGRSANTAYLYKVRTVNGGESADSNVDLATTTIFTDDPLLAGPSTIKSTHFNEMRTAVNAVRTLASLAAGTYTDPSLTVGVTLVKAVHVSDLRAAIDEARETLALSAVLYSEAITATTTTIKATHVIELRSGVR